MGKACRLGSRHGQYRTVSSNSNTAHIFLQYATQTVCFEYEWDIFGQ